MYKMRKGLIDCLNLMKYKETITLDELSNDAKECLVEAVEDSTIEGIINWEQVSLQMQFFSKIFPTGWEKVFNELNLS